MEMAYAVHMDGPPVDFLQLVMDNINRQHLLLVTDQCQGIVTN